MNNDEAPTWLIALTALFGSAAAISFGIYLFYYAENAALKEQIDLTEFHTKNVLQPRKVDLQNRISAAEASVPMMRAALAKKRVGDQDELRAITSQLLPVHERALVEIDNEIQRRQTTFTAQLTAAQRARRELSQIEEQALVDEQAAREERSRLRVKIEELSQELEEVKRGQRHQLLELEQVVADRTARVQELVDRRDVKTDEMLSDGLILQANVTDGFVVLNRGLENDLHEGTKFVVFNRRGGTNQVKGEIEVIRSEPRMAIARVLSEADANDPIIPGDHIHNTIYNPEEQKVYVVKGDFSYFSRTELMRFIEDAGGKVDPDISKRTDYLVAGTNAAFALEEASLNGVTILSENKLLEMVRAQDRFTVRRGMTFAIVGEFTNVDVNTIERWVEVNGGLATDSIDDDVDVLIAGENAAEAITRASLTGATIINQQQLVHLMGTTAAK